MRTRWPPLMRGPYGVSPSLRRPLWPAAGARRRRNRHDVRRAPPTVRGPGRTHLARRRGNGRGRRCGRHGARRAHGDRPRHAREPGRGRTRRGGRPLRRRHGSLPGRRRGGPHRNPRRAAPAGRTATTFAGGACTGRDALAYPTAVAVDADGDVYVAEATAERVQEVPAGSRTPVTVAGTGSAGYNGDGRRRRPVSWTSRPASPSTRRATSSSPTPPTAGCVCSRRGRPRCSGRP